MRVVLKYRRLPKPRGGWRYGLWFLFRVEYSEREREELNPTWEWKGDITNIITDPDTGKKIPVSKSPKANHEDWWLHKTFLSAEGCSLSPYNLNNVNYHVHVKVTPQTDVEATVYFLHPEWREKFIEALHFIQREVAETANRWWHEHPPHPGDEFDSEAVLVVERGEIREDGTAAGQPSRKRKIEMKMKGKVEVGS